MKYTDEQLVDIATNEGTICSGCYRKISIYRYGVTPTMVELLQAAATQVRDQLSRAAPDAFNVDTLAISHSTRSQTSKMRQHGFFRRALNQDGKQIPSHWVINPKAYDFLRGKAVPYKVEVYDNTVIGHTGGSITISEVLKSDKPANDPGVLEQEHITPTEARHLSNLREPAKKPITTEAVFQRRSFGSLVHGQTYTLEIDGLKFGSKVHVTVTGEGIDMPIMYNYENITAYRADWKIME